MSNTTVAFLDFEAVLFDRAGTDWRARDVFPLLSRLAKNHRLGLLCNLPKRFDADALKLLLKDHGILAWFEPELVVIASNLPTPLPDRRAFAAAAALAEAKPDALTYITANPDFAAAAGALGWKTSGPADPAAPALMAGPAAAAAPQLFAVDDDTGPTFILRGRIVTMDSANRVVNNGRLIISKGKIAAVLDAGQAVPAAFAGAPVIDTGATLYPGLIDLHNHLPYNVAPLWKTPKLYKNRNEWRGNADYKRSVANPVVALAQQTATAKALVRYVECKAIAGGATTGQGMRMKEKGVTKYFVGAMRNVESTDDPLLPDATTRVPDLNPNRLGDPEAFEKNLNNPKIKAFFYHLCEGVNPAARQHFLNLTANDPKLIGESLVGIHALALERADLDALAAVKAKIVWSPLSNFLLYGKTLSLKDVLASGVRVALGCDWSPSGSKNPLLELKVARWVAQQQGVALSSRQLVGMLTDGAAAVAGWQKALGSIEAGKYADVIAIAGENGEAHDHLIDARERNVQLVIVHGIARYGDENLMLQLKPGTQAQMEKATVDGAAKRFFLQHPKSLINDLSYATATDRLKTAMDDLKAFIQSAPAPGGLMAAGLAADDLRLELDMEEPDDGGASGFADPALMAVTPDQVADSVPLDPIASSDAAFWTTMTAEPNLPNGLVAAIRPFYN